MSGREEANLNSPAPQRNLNELPSKTFTIKDFELKIFQAERSIIYHATEIKDLTGTLYKTELDLDKLCKLNSIFRAFDSVEKVFRRFQKLDESKIIIKKEENKIIVTLILEFMGEQEEAKIILIPQQVKIDDIVMKLCDKVKEIDVLNQIINEQKSENEKLRKEFNDYKNYSENKITELEATIKTISENLKNNIEFYNGKYLEKEEYNKIKEEKAKLKQIIDTNIMKYNELFLIKDGIKNKLKKNIKKCNLLFKASINGFGSSNFHSLCDGKNNTLTLVETTAGRRFGGFTDAQWDKSSSYKTGSNGFIFSLDNKEIYYNKNSDYNIYCNSNRGPTFGGGHDFVICNNCNNSNESYDDSGNSYDTNGKKYALVGQSNFLVKDYEVYQLDLE